MSDEVTLESLVFDISGEDIQFSVNVEKRTIGGLIVPWNVAAMDNRGQGRWRFKKGSLWWTDTSRVKLNAFHDHRQTVGYATHLQNVPQGVYAKFRIARGEEGDRALAAAEDKTSDAFSVEVDPTDAVWEFDRSETSTRNVSRARLVATALVPVPAFDDARVDLIAASTYQGEVMEEKKTDDEPTEEPVAFEQHLTTLAEKLADSQEKALETFGSNLGETMTAGFRAALENVADPQGPETVRAARFGTLKEPPVYSFDGRGDSIVRDASAWVRDRDDDALERIRKFRRQSEDITEVVRTHLAFAPQTTSTASQVIPPGYRPDLYVADLFRQRPLVNLGSQGTIANATPFTVPTFTSVTTGSADHVEGTNPSDGSLAFGTKTVTPGAISGRIVLSREIVDSSNPAIDQIAFAEMRESYARQTEAKVYTLLNGANGAGGTITSGFVPSGAQAATYVGTSGTPPALIAGIRKQLALYPFARFASPDGAAMGQNAASILAQAADSTGRPIYPSIGATNSAGTSNPVDSGFNVDGLAVRAAWAMTGTAAGDSQIFFVNSSDLWVWESPLLSFRFEEKQGPANIELDIFGYFATHLIRPVGLMGIRIT